MGVFTFLNNHYFIPHVVVHEVNPKVGAISCLTPAALDWSP